MALIRENDIYVGRYKEKEVKVYGITNSSGLNSSECLSKTILLLSNSANILLDYEINNVLGEQKELTILELAKMTRRGGWNDDIKQLPLINGEEVEVQGTFYFKSENGLENLMKDKELSPICDENGNTIALYKENLLIPLYTIVYGLKSVDGKRKAILKECATKFYNYLLNAMGIQTSIISELEYIGTEIGNKIKVEREQKIDELIKEQLYKIEKHRKDLTTLLINVNENKAKLKGLQEAGYNVTFTPNDKIENISLEGDNLYCKTKHLYFRASNGGRYSLGEMLIEYGLNDHHIRFFNQTDKRRSVWGRGCNAPHVDQRGEGCLGNASEAIAIFSSNFEFSALFDICIAYLETSNLEDSAGKYTMNWDKVDEEGNIIRKGFVDEDKYNFKYDKYNHEKDTYIGDKYVLCEVCNEYHVGIYTINDEKICKSCKEKKYKKCARCGKYELRGDREENVFTCDECKVIVEKNIQEIREAVQKEESLITLKDGRRVKESSAYYCTECDSYVSVDNFNESTYICYECEEYDEDEDESEEF